MIWNLSCCLKCLRVHVIYYDYWSHPDNWRRWQGASLVEKLILRIRNTFCNVHQIPVKKNPWVERSLSMMVSEINFSMLDSYIYYCLLYLPSGLNLNTPNVSSVRTRPCELNWDNRKVQLVLSSFVTTVRYCSFE